MVRMVNGQTWKPLVFLLSIASWTLPSCEDGSTPGPVLSATPPASASVTSAGATVPDASGRVRTPATLKRRRNVPDASTRDRAAKDEGRRLTVQEQKAVKAALSHLRSKGIEVPSSPEYHVSKEGGQWLVQIWEPFPPVPPGELPGPGGNRTLVWLTAPDLRVVRVLRDQ
jgi:hypothetical protein